MTRLASFVLLVSLATVPAAAAGQVRRELLGVSPSPPATNADTFFDDSRLHEIRLVISSKDWQSLKDHFLDNTYYPCDLRWGNHVVRNVGIRSRGTGSRSGVKPGLRVDVDRYTSDQTFLGLKSFVLRNNTQDASNLHERLSMLFFRRMGLPASREAHTKLYVNNEYAGLYSIVEAADKTFLKRTLGENDGYLYEYDYPADAAPYYFEDRGSDPSLYVPLPFKPETHEDDARPEFIVRLIQTINQASDTVFRTAIAEYLDLAKFIRHVAVEVFLADNDGLIGDYGMNNFYLYRFDNRNLFTFIPWDKSEAFKGGISYGIFHNITDTPASKRNRLLTRGLAYADLYDLYQDTLLECAQSAAEPESAGGPGWLTREIQREYGQIRDAAIADTLKPYSNEDFELAVEELRLFAEQRGPYVAREVSQTRSTRTRRSTSAPLRR